MTDDPIQKNPPPPQGSGRALKIVLAISLAFNLAVIGIVSGAFLKARHGDWGRPPDVRELNFGPFSEALSRPQRRDLLRGLIGDRPGLRDLRNQIGGEFAAVLAAVRAEPFDPAALDAALRAQGEGTVERLDRGRKALQAVIIAMTPEERAAYADRLQQGLSRSKDGGRGGDGRP
jgi:uncharacterized membrane protein